jgi:hypothetical protein
MSRVDGMKRGQGKRWWDFESCTIKRRKEDTRSLHRKIFSLFSFFFFLSAFLFYMFDMISRFLFSVQASRAWRFGWGIIRCVNKAFLLFSRLPKMSCEVG